MPRILLKLSLLLHSRTLHPSHIFLRSHHIFTPLTKPYIGDFIGRSRETISLFLLLHTHA